MPERVGALQAGSSTDALVARTIFGMVVKPTPEGPMCKGAGDPADIWTPLKPYSTDNDAADAIVARFRRRFQFREIRDGFEWVVFFGFFADKNGVPTIEILVQVRAATRPLAICEAGLILVDKLARGRT